MKVELINEKVSFLWILEIDLQNTLEIYFFIALTLGNSIGLKYRVVWLSYKICVWYLEGRAMCPTCSKFLKENYNTITSSSAVFTVFTSEGCIVQHKGTWNLLHISYSRQDHWNRCFDSKYKLPDYNAIISLSVIQCYSIFDSRRKLKTGIIFSDVIM